MEFIPRIVLIFLILPLLSVIKQSFAIHFTKTSRTYASFPKWNACTNSSLSFEFKTRNDKALLMYTDDNGNYDYVEVMVYGGAVRLRMNIVDGREGSVEITLGRNVNDGRWHRVEVQRNRMETTLYMDEFHESRVAFGSDFYFGNISDNNFVYFGGLPRKYRNILGQLSLSSVFYEPRFEGEIRNVIYGNCTCRPVRGEMLDGESVSRDPKEACEVNNNCGKCLCISGDDGPGCQCLGFSCPHESGSYYHLPMDVIDGDQIPNPSGLDAKVTGNPQLVRGVVYKALKIDGTQQKVKVSGPGHRNECFGDLSLCTEGYTIGMWVKFDSAGRGNGVYLSNGGHSTSSHGVAMLYQTGSLQWIFRMKSGREWRATATNILPRRWFQVTVTWSERRGLLVYVNGNKAAQGDTPTMNVGRTSSSSYNDFVIGQSNDAKGTRDLGVMTVDDFRFWAVRLDETTLREKGPIYQYHLTMDQLQDGQLIVKDLEPRTIGRLRKDSGKYGNAVQLPGRGQYIDLGIFSDTCLGNTSLCMYGFTVSLWIKFDRLEDNTYYMASGVTGFAIFTYGSRLYANVQYGDRQYQASASDVQTGLWYFTEVTWNPTTGLEIYLNQILKVSQTASNHYQVTSSGYDNFYIGRANTRMYNERYAAATFDDIRLYNADIERLLAIDFIQREKPPRHYYGFDEMDGLRIKHPTTVIDTVGNPKLVPGKIGQALRLNGNQQKADFDNGDDCLSNIDYCRHGILVSLWFRPETAKEGMYYLSSGQNGVDIYYMNGKFKTQVTNSVYRWEIVMSQLEPNTWYFMEITWSEEFGLKLYVNNKLIEGDRFPSEVSSNRTSTSPGDKFTLGQSNNAGSGNLFGAATYDEMEFWYASRDYLLAFDYIQRGRPENYHIDMEAIKDGGRQIEYSRLPVMLTGNPLLTPGKFGNALLLNGRNQFIDFGERNDKCLANLDYCHFGISIFFWVKVNEYDYNMYLLSTGNEGIKIYYNLGYIYITVDHDRKSWRMSVPKVTENEWHFLEISWHPDFGLSFYVDNEFQDLVSYRSIPEIRTTGNEHFYIGAPNLDDIKGQRFNYAKMAVDDVEIWYGRREELLAFDYIIRENVGYESFSMETASGGVIDHPNYRVTLERGARLVPGKIGNGVSLQGSGDYIDFGQHMDKCFANIAECKHGLTISLWLYPRSLRTNQYFLASPTYSLYLDNGELKSKFMLLDKSWTVHSGNIHLNDWNNIKLSWDQNQGLKMYIDDRLMDRDTEPADEMQGDAPQNGNLYIGKSSDKNVDGSANMMADELQFWYANMERLKAQGLYRGPIHEVLPLGQMPASGTLKLPSRTITLRGGATVVQGQHGSAIRLAGKGQYIDMGENLTCGGNLDNCRQGFTMRFSTKPERLQSNMYYLDSYPISIFYRDGKLYATIRTNTKTWTVAAPGFKTGEWQVVDVSWHPEIGLTMFVNEEEVGSHKTHGTDIEPVYDYDRSTVFGKAMTNMINERYADALIENFEIWNVRRDVLMAEESSSTDAHGDLSPGSGQTPKPPISTPKINTLPPPSADDSTTQGKNTHIYVVMTVDIFIPRRRGANSHWIE